MTGRPHETKTATHVAVALFTFALAACGSVTGGMDAAGGAGGGSGGAAGTGTGGTTGTAGTTGTGGTTGIAGSTGRGGSDVTGTAGRGGTTGTAGRGGTTGTAGRGGTTGAAGRGGTTGTAGRGGTTGMAGTSGGGGRGGSGGSAGSAGGAGAGGTGGTGGTGGICNVLCTTGRMCCSGTCVNLQNDPSNCGKCGNICQAPTAFCNNGVCQSPTCEANVFCPANTTCCGNGCCTNIQICCEDQGPISVAPTCYTPTKDQPTCPAGCAPLCKSDRNIKKDIAPVDARQILDKVARLPISTWTYVDEPAGIRHLGPMAQDFHASFGLGADDRTYNSVDAHGVSLAAIQALQRMLAEQEKRIEKLERENRRLEQRLHARGAPATER